MTRQPGSIITILYHFGVAKSHLLLYLLNIITFSILLNPSSMPSKWYHQFCLRHNMLNYDYCLYYGNIILFIYFAPSPPIPLMWNGIQTKYDTLSLPFVWDRIVQDRRRPSVFAKSPRQIILAVAENNSGAFF